MVIQKNIITHKFHLTQLYTVHCLLTRPFLGFSGFSRILLPCFVVWETRNDVLLAQRKNTYFWDHIGLYCIYQYWDMLIFFMYIEYRESTNVNYSWYLWLATNWNMTRMWRFNLFNYTIQTKIFYFHIYIKFGLNKNQRIHYLR